MKLNKIFQKYKFLPLYIRQKNEWLRQGGKITRIYRILSDYNENAGTAKGHYFHQDLLVACFINEAAPKRHIDVGSRIDGFVAHVASFREIEVLDVRPLMNSEHKNIVFKKADLMSQPDIGHADSISCLHAIEHFGLGRYSDKIDVNGHIKGINNLVNILEEGGTLYISFPIGKGDEVHFNAHRVFHPSSILEYEAVKKHLILRRFDYVDNKGNLHCNVDIDDAIGKVKYGCGIYTFEKKS